MWIGAKQIATDAANAILRAQPGMEGRQGDMMAPEPLEQLVTTVIRSAEALADYPDTGEFVSQLTEIAHRWETRGRQSPAEWRKDLPSRTRHRDRNDGAHDARARPASNVSFEAATLAIAVLSLVLAALSLGWQAATFFLEGGRVRAEFRPGAMGPGGLITLRRGAPFTVEDAQMVASQGFTRPIVAVEVRNVGRLPVTVTSWRVATRPGEMALQPAGASIGPSLPHRLEGGETATWAVDMAPVKALVDTTSTLLKVPAGRTRVAATVSLGDGRTVRAKGLL